MKQKKKHLLLFIGILFVIVMVGIVYQLQSAGILFTDEMKHLNGPNLWFQMLNSRVGSIVALLLPIVISFGTTYYFYKELNSGIYKDRILRDGYQKTMIKLIGKCHLMALVFPAVMLLFLGISFLIAPQFTTDIKEGMATQISNPWGYNIKFIIENITWMLLLQYLFALFTTNLSLFCIRYFKKFYIVLISVFILCNLFNFIVTGIGGMLGTNAEYVFEMMMTEYKASGILSFLICLPISYLMLYIAYKNQEKVVIDHVDTVPTV